jgi:hypothetical protein
MTGLLASKEMNETMEVKISDLADLAVDVWRLHRWAFMNGFERDRTVARQASRTLSSFLTETGVEVCDLTGQAYDPGHAVEVIDVEHAPNGPTDSANIVEMIAPIVLWQGRVIRTGQVIVCRGQKQEQEIRN